MAAVSICIPTHNRSQLIKQTLESARQIEVPVGVDVEVIVLANACDDDTEKVVAEARSRLPFNVCCVADPLPNLNHARNRCVEEASGDILAFLDDDVLLDQQWLVGMLSTYENNPADLVGGRIDLYWHDLKRPMWFDQQFDSFLTFVNHGDDEIELKSMYGAYGANFSFRRSVYDRIGPFIVGLDRSARGLLSGGESEFIDRALRGGFRMFHAPQMRVQHWVLPERLTLSYVGGVARGNGESRIYFKSDFGFLATMRSIAGHLYLVVLHGLAELMTKSMSSAKARHHVRRRSGMGGLVGIWKRLTGRSPVARQRVKSVRHQS